MRIDFADAADFVGLDGQNFLPQSNIEAHSFNGDGAYFGPYATFTEDGAGTTWEARGSWPASPGAMMQKDTIAVVSSESSGLTGWWDEECFNLFSDSSPYSTPSSGEYIVQMLPGVLIAKDNNRVVCVHFDLDMTYSFPSALIDATYWESPGVESPAWVSVGPNIAVAPEALSAGKVGNDEMLIVAGDQSLQIWGRTTSQPYLHPLSTDLTHLLSALPEFNAPKFLAATVSPGGRVAVTGNDSSGTFFAYTPLPVDLTIPLSGQVLFDFLPGSMTSYTWCHPYYVGETLWVQSEFGLTEVVDAFDPTSARVRLGLIDEDTEFGQYNIINNWGPLAFAGADLQNMILVQEIYTTYGQGSLVYLLSLDCSTIIHRRKYSGLPLGLSVTRTAVPTSTPVFPGTTPDVQD
jgi:hypothetical protein